MNTWTDAARTDLERYFANIRAAITASGADADEVIEDLKRHLDAEIKSAGLTVVTADDVGRLLARIGAPAAEASSSIPTTVQGARPAAAEPRPPGLSGWAAGGLLFAGVILPAVTLLLEYLTAMCAGAFFDPIPTVWHVLAVAFVPVANGLVWCACRRGDLRRRALLGWFNGAALGIALFYSILFAPLMLPGLVAIILLGWGLLPLSPAFSLVAAIALRRRLRAMAPEPGIALPGLWRGVALAWLALLAFEVPPLITRVGLDMAASESPDTRRAGIQWLRRLGDEDILLRACYGQSQVAQNFDLIGWIVSGRDRIHSDKAREIYFRVTGRAFNSVPPPNVRTARGRWTVIDEWTWDEDHGGERVGGRLKGLTLHSSRLDAVVDPAGVWSYTEWMMEFKNDSSQQREARAQILLPPGGLVSRLTLWVNGEEREAAFSGRSHVREAYQKIAIQQRRDPVLVTTSGPDRILMQCFPVPARGGVMKIRFGITAPVHLDDVSLGRVKLPSFLERNFTIPKDFKHAIWADVKGTMDAGVNALKAEPGKPGHTALRGQWDDSELSEPRATLVVKRDPNLRLAWTADSRDGKGRFIRQTIEQLAAPAADRLVLVVDGSKDMAPFLGKVASAVRQSPATMDLEVLVASDEVVQLSANQARGLPGRESVAAALASWRASGGQDSIPALIRARDLAAEKPDGVIVWIHGPQPVLLQPVDALAQAWERRPEGPTLYELSTEPGPNRVIEKLDVLTAVHSVPRFGSLEEDLSRLIRLLQPGGRTIALKREATDTEAQAKAGGAYRTAGHLARLWASSEVSGLRAARETREAVRLATLYQLVTPVSGAVVLETAAQYAQTGLTPVDPQTVPAIPEPGTLALMVAAVLVLLTWRVRRWANIARS